MIEDFQYSIRSLEPVQSEHRYGANVRILSHPYAFTLLAQLGSATCHQPQVSQLMRTLYEQLTISVVNEFFPLKKTMLETRMKSQHSEAEFMANIIDPGSSVVSVSVARAGTVPSQICFDLMNRILDPNRVRQDFISINRATDEKGRVIGTNLSGHKIGGKVDGSLLMIPDPMGASGSTLKSVMELYRSHGKAKDVIAMHLIVTPEYLRAVQQYCPEVKVIAYRLDRGLSATKLLETIPGENWDEEKGLNDKQYIIPGAGGLGEVMNNSYV